jgi:hypothetical protein
MVPVYALTAIAIALIAVWSIAILARVRSATLVQASADVRQFTMAAKIIVADKTVPDSVVEFVGWLSNEIKRPRLAMWITAQILNGRINGEISTQSSELSNDIDALKEEQRQALAQCIAYGLLSSAGASPVFASYLHRVISFALFEARTRRVTDSEKTRAIIVEFNQRDKRAHRAHFEMAHA